MLLVIKTVFAEMKYHGFQDEVNSEVKLVINIIKLILTQIL